MQVFNLNHIRTQYAEVPIKVDSFFVRRTGLLSAQTVLKLGDYNLNVVPGVLGFEEIRILAVLSPQEAALFSRYTQVMNDLTLCFDQPEKKDPLRFHFKVNLLSIESVPHRPNVCFLNLKPRNIPGEFTQIVGAYFQELEHRQGVYEKLADQFIELNPEVAGFSGYSGPCELSRDGETLKLDLLGFSSKEARFKVLGEFPDKFRKNPSTLKFPFKISTFSMEVTPEGPPPGSSELKIPLPFHLEFLEMVEDCLFKIALASRKKTPGTNP